MTTTDIDATPVRILFVCLGNICRSPAAQGVMQKIIDDENVAHKYILDSAGLYGGHAGDLPDHRMRVHARRRGYELTHRSRQVKHQDFDNFDMIVAMDDSNLHNLRAMACSIEEEDKIVSMASFLRMNPSYDYVPDPYYEGSEGFEIVLDLLEDACRGLYEEIEK